MSENTLNAGDAAVPRLQVTYEDVPRVLQEAAEI